MNIIFLSKEVHFYNMSKVCVNKEIIYITLTILGSLDHLVAKLQCYFQLLHKDNHLNEREKENELLVCHFKNVLDKIKKLGIDGAVFANFWLNWFLKR